jgi:beta-fructofuranosidase
MDNLNKEVNNTIKGFIKLNNDDRYSDNWRLKYHIMPPTGWLNASNGICEFNDEHHVFYQYSPFGVKDGMNFIAHISSKDLINWNDVSIQLYPCGNYDVDSVYSGAVLVDGGNLNMFYTSGDNKTGIQSVIHLLSEDGVDFENVKTILRNTDVISDASDEILESYNIISDSFSKISDPYVWKENETYYMIIGGKSNSSSTIDVLLYKSKDLIKWRFLSNIAIDYDDSDILLRSPNILKIDGKHVLTLSLYKKDSENNETYTTGYFVGEINLNSYIYKNFGFNKLDNGHDFYLPNIYKDSKGRNILIACMGTYEEHNKHTDPTVFRGWKNALSIPREIKLHKEKIVQTPVDEIKMLRKNKIEKEINLNCVTIDESLKGEVYEMIVDIIDIQGCFKIRLRREIDIKYDDISNTVTISLGNSGYGRKDKLIEINKLDKIHIFSDSSSIEIFINDGEEVFTSRVYPNKNEDLIMFKGNGKIQVNKWDY